MWEKKLFGGIQNNKVEKNNKIEVIFHVKYDTSHIIYETNNSPLLYKFFSLDFDNIISFFYFLFIFFTINNIFPLFLN